MAKIKIGDIFEIETPKGKAYIHYIYNDKSTGALVRVLHGLYQETPINFDNIAGVDERFMISFPLSAATHRKITKCVGFYPADKFSKPPFMRTEHIIRGEFLGWHIINTDTWHRQLVKSLNTEQKKLSPWGIWNDILLIENLTDGWSLEKWG